MSIRNEKNWSYSTCGDFGASRNGKKITICFKDFKTSKDTKDYFRCKITGVWVHSFIKGLHFIGMGMTMFLGF